MAKEKSLGSVKRFGPRYGRTTKKKFAVIEKEHRKLHDCPYCNYTKVKRKSQGIWHCKKCNATFTGKAYSVKKEIKIKEIEKEEPEVLKEEEEEEKLKEDN